MTKSQPLPTPRSQRLLRDFRVGSSPCDYLMIAGNLFEVAPRLSSRGDES